MAAAVAAAVTSSDAVVFFIIVVLVIVGGGGAGLSAGTKPWRRTSWSFRASGRRRHLGGEARWRPDEAVRHAAHLAMGLVRPPLPPGQSRRPSSSALPVSVVVGIVGIIASSRRCCIVVAPLSSLSLVLITFTAAITLASVIAAAIAVATNATAAALR